MAKRGSAKKSSAMAGEWKPPTPAERLNERADDMAHDAVRAHPQYKKMHAKAKSAIHGAAKKAMRGGSIRNVRSA